MEHVSLENHASMNIWASQIVPDGLKKKQQQKTGWGGNWELLREEFGDEYDQKLLHKTQRTKKRN